MEIETKVGDVISTIEVLRKNKSDPPAVCVATYEPATMPYREALLDTIQKDPYYQHPKKRLPTSPHGSILKPDFFVESICG